METIARRGSVGLIIGKFFPPHLGHLHLVEMARRRVDRLVVLVYPLRQGDIPGELRAAWLRELFPDVLVRHVDDLLPAKPSDHPDFWPIWGASVRRAFPEPIDLVFSSEDYGDELARRVGARHVLCDRERRSVPISGTAIRADPMAHWEFLPPPVRPWYVRRIVLIGSESTGKSTLSTLLGQHFRTVCVPEFGREFVDAKGAMPEEHEMVDIARGQAASEERLAREANRVLLLDTDVVTTEVYSGHYFGRVAPEVEALADGRSARVARYLLTHPDVPWVPDPQRDRGDRRDEMHALFREALRRRGIRPVDIRGSWQARRGTAVTAVEDAMAERPSVGG
jgi:NadR type nicotinamide-nucleotide adenylyltransferase